MTTKKELELKLEDLRISKQSLYSDNLGFVSEIRELKDILSRLEDEKKNILRECNQRAQIIQQILSIISGEAKPISKFEVIRDMFLPQLKEEELLQESRNRVYNYSRTRFLSEELNEHDFRV